MLLYNRTYIKNNNYFKPLFAKSNKELLSNVTAHKHENGTFSYFASFYDGGYYYPIQIDSKKEMTLKEIKKVGYKYYKTYPHIIFE